MERIFEYAIVRIVPYAHRGEQLNIGVVVFNPDTIDVIIDAPANVLKAFGATPRLTEWVATYIKDTDDCTLPVGERWKRLKKSPGFTVSEVGWFSTYEESDYEYRTQEILQEYVKRPKSFSAPEKKKNIVLELRKIFQTHNIMGRKAEDLENHKVVSNVSVGPSGKLHIDFLLRNGFYHATETIDFRGSDDAGVSELKDAALAAFTLKYAREQLGSNSTKCYLVYAAPHLVERAVQPAISLVEPNVDKIFNLESEYDKNTYIDYMIEASGISILRF